jgi:hypothetical protein
MLLSRSLVDITNDNIGCHCQGYDNEEEEKDLHQNAVLSISAR